MNPKNNNRGYTRENALAELKEANARLYELADNLGGFAATEAESIARLISSVEDGLGEIFETN